MITNNFFRIIICSFLSVFFLSCSQQSSFSKRKYTKGRFVEKRFRFKDEKSKSKDEFLVKNNQKTKKSNGYNKKQIIKDLPNALYSDSLKKKKRNYKDSLKIERKRQRDSIFREARLKRPPPPSPFKFRPTFRKNKEETKANKISKGLGATGIAMYVPIIAGGLVSAIYASIIGLIVVAVLLLVLIGLMIWSLVKNTKEYTNSKSSNADKTRAYRKSNILNIIGLVMLALVLLAAILALIIFLVIIL